MSKIKIPIKDPNKFVVTQSNELVEARYSTELTAQAHKIARLVVSLISPDDKDLRSYTISISALKAFLGINSNVRWGAFYDRLKETAQRLNSEPIEIKEGDGKYLVAYFLSGYRINTQAGTITFEISNLLKPYLLELKKNYTGYLLAHIPKLKSAYSIRLYELLHQYRKIGKRHFKLDDLQKKVGSSYNKYSHFKNKVLQQAQKDLKKHTDLAFVFDEIKEGRKVAGIQFIIFGNTPEKENPTQLSFLDDAFEVNDNEKPALSEIIVQSLNSLGVSEQNIAKYLARGFEIITDTKSREVAQKRCTSLENYYLEKLELTKNSASSKENAAGFFIKALKEDWATSKTVQKHKTNEAVLQRKQAETKLRKLQNQLEKLIKERDTKKEVIIEQLDDVMFESAYKATMDGLGDFIKGTLLSVKHLPIREQYAEKMAIHSGVNIHLQENNPEKFASLHPIEEKIQQIEKAIADLN